MNRETASTTIVTVDDGTGPVKALKDSLGRIITAEEVRQLHERQRVDHAGLIALRDKLVANDAEATAQLVDQVKRQTSQRLGLIERQKAQMQETLAKLEARDAATVQGIADQMARRLGHRADRLAQVRDRTATLLAQLQADEDVVPAEAE